MPDAPRIEINYEVCRAIDNEFITEGKTTQAFVDAKTGKPARSPIL